MINGRLSVTSLLLTTAVVGLAQNITFTQYPASAPTGITTGPDSNIWYTEGNVSGDHIGKIVPSTGAATLYAIPSGSAEGAITSGPDGNLWFTEYRTNIVARISPSTGAIVEFPLPPGSYFGASFPFGITSGPDGNVWFAGALGNVVGSINPATNVITEYSVPSPAQVVAGRDGNLWFTGNNSNLIGNINPTNGLITEFPIPTSGSYPFGITAGTDGNLWFPENLGNKIGRITPAGVITEFPITTGANPGFITVGPDGNLWFNVPGYIGKVTATGTITEFPIPSTSNGFITLGPDHNLWLADPNGNQIFKISIGPLYNLCLLYDPTKEVHSGAVLPVKLELCDASGADLSSSTITLHAVSVTMVSTSTSGEVINPGNANPDNDFRFDQTLGTLGGYIMNLKTTGLTTGTYNLNFTVTGDSSTHAAPFQVK